MHRRIPIALALTLLIITAGCANPLSPSPNDTADTTTTEITTQEPASLPDGYSDSGITDTNIAVGAHESALKDAGSWTITYDTEVLIGDNPEGINDRRVVEHDNKRAYRAAKLGGLERNLYQNETVSYRMKTDASNNTEYTFTAEGYNSSSEVYSHAYTKTIAYFLSNVNYEKSGETARNGVTYFTYESTGLPEDSDFAQSKDSESHLEDVESTLIVSENGQVVEYELAATSVSSRGEGPLTISLQITDVGATSFETPRWVSDAKENTTPE